MHPISHAGLETGSTLLANVIIGCSFNLILQTTEMYFHLQMASALVQRIYYVAESEHVYPKMVNRSSFLLINKFF